MLSQVLARPPNWLPLPQVGLVKAPEIRVDENDLFSKGEITSFYPRQGFGLVKDRNGNEIYFKLDELDLVGPKADRTYINVGATVGFDISQTSSGPHIRTLKVY